MSAPNRDLEQAGHSLSTIIAVNLTAALEHVRRELAVLDGFPERGDQVAVRASSEMTSVERAVDQRYVLLSAREDLRDRKQAVLVAIRELNDLINHVSRLRAPKSAPERRTLCRDGIVGKDGAHLSRADGGWSDEQCFNHPYAQGLCEPCYRRWLRWKKTQGTDTERQEQDIENAAMVVRITVTESGAVLVRRPSDA